MRIAILDNYDSFTYNLVHFVEEITGNRPTVFRNDEIGVEALMAFDKIMLSPGPGLPNESGILMQVIAELAPRKSILGVCLGHEAIGEFYGGTLFNLDKVYHGIATDIHVADSSETLFEGVDVTFSGGRYHSWAVAREGFPTCLKITALDEQGQIMALAHRDYDLKGVQFHPESVLTPQGGRMLRNWLK